MKAPLIKILALLLIVSCNSNKTEYALSHKDIDLQVFMLGNKQLAYCVHKGDQTLIDTSLLGISINDTTLGVNSNIKLEATDVVGFEYPILGVKNIANYHGSISRFEIQETNGISWFLEFQISDEGVAYRYIIPKKGKNLVNGERSSFKLPDNTKVWYFERNNSWKLKSHAGEWISAGISQMPTVSKMGPVQGLTLTLEMPDGSYALLAEAALFNYSGMRLEATGNNTFQANFTENRQGFEIEGDIITPWRCILLANSLNELVNITMVASLNPKPDETLFSDVSWIKPGKAAWYWWSGKFSTFEKEKKTIDNAAKLGFQYTMIDEGWEKWENKWETITALNEYARNKGLELFLWKRSSEINIPDNNYAVMAAFLDSVKQTGAVGVKVDFMNGQDKSIIDFDEAVLKLAAERRLMVNFHGCQQSSGEYRTYPNEITREGIRGVELNNMAEGPLPASHNAALPFTRYVTGHADYTPVAFTAPGETTWAHQLATLVCFYSPFQCIAEDPEFLLSSREIQPALNFIKNVPSVWDETIVLPDSKIGELAIIARRKGTDWYLGVLSSGPEKQLNVNCNFLSEGQYVSEVFMDDMLAEPINLEGLNPRANLTRFDTAVPFRKELMECNKTTMLNLEIGANGGAAIWFRASDNIIE